MTFWIKNSKDGQFAFYGYRGLYFEEMVHELIRVKVEVASSEADTNYEHTVFSSAVNFCEEKKGTQKNIFTRLVMGNSKDQFAKFKCPFSKNVWIVMIIYFRQ